MLPGQPEAPPAASALWPNGSQLRGLCKDSNNQRRNADQDGEESPNHAQIHQIAGAQQKAAAAIICSVRGTEMRITALPTTSLGDAAQAPREQVCAEKPNR
jgi:hypothetical protein